MANNYYDDAHVFKSYSEMERSQQGLQAAGEWAAFEALMPDLKGAHVLDLGCGYGWHCQYALEQGAARVVGIDISEKMLETAKQQPRADEITFINASLDDLEDLEFEAHEFDVVLSSLALHYLPSFTDIVRQVKEVLTINGTFIFSIEHPIFTAHNNAAFLQDSNGNSFWPVSGYQQEGERRAEFLGKTMVKYHRTLEHYISALIEENFVLKGISEPVPPEHMMTHPHMQDELERPMMLILSARRK